MRKICISILALLFLVGVAYGVPFEPPVIEITGQDVQWTGGDCVIPFTLGGRDCNVYLAVYTKGLGPTMPRVYNGIGPEGVDLDYHTVVGIDTCIYVTAGEPFTQGNRQIVWDGKDKIGRQMEPGLYTYYLLAAGEENDPVVFSPQMYSDPEQTTLVRGGWRPSAAQSNANVQYFSQAEGKMERPRWWWYLNYWEFGQDTETGDFVKTYLPPEGIGPNACTQIDPENDDVIFFTYWDVEAESGVLAKALLVPEAPAELVTEFGEEGKYFMYGTSRSIITGGNSRDGVSLVGPYDSTVPEAVLHVVDSGTGELLYELDAFEWFTSTPEEVERNARASEIGKWGWNPFMPSRLTNVQHCTCSRLCINPQEEDDWLIWANMNGDYYCDHNYPGCEGFLEDTAWLCNDCKPGSYQYQEYGVKYGFVFYTTNLGGTHNMEILGPDGYGMFKFNVLGQLNNAERWWSIIVDGDTAFDGMYTPLTTGAADDPAAKYTIPSWLGYDSFEGIITVEVGVEAGTPAAYSLSNAPDPFNPSTTISYGMAKAGHMTLEVYNVMGQKVATLYDGYRDTGTYSVRWDASDFSNGVYFAVMKAEGFTKTEKMMLVK